MTNKKLYKSPDKKIFGVCAGIADYFNIDPTLVRLIVVALATYTLGTVAAVYLVLGLAIDNPPDNYFEINVNTSKRLTKSADKKICGVCGGIAQALNVDPRNSKNSVGTYNGLDRRYARTYCVSCSCVHYAKRISTGRQKRKLNTGYTDLTDAQN